MPTKRIVCLANSRKPDGRCVAGKEFDGTTVGPWVRPVSARPGGEVSESERHYPDGKDPRVLDVVDVPLLRAMPKGHQKENWILDPDDHWIKAGRVTQKILSKLVDTPKLLWVNGDSTFNGANDRVAEATAKTLPSSLYLIKVAALGLKVFAPGAERFNNPKRRVLGSFKYGGVSYAFWVTDPVLERAYLAKENGTYKIGECFLTISLGEVMPEQKACYKLIATVFEGT